MIQKYKICIRCNTNEWYIQKQLRYYSNGTKSCVCTKYSCVQCSKIRSKINAPKQKEYKKNWSKLSFKKEKIIAELSPENMLKYKFKNGLRYINRSKTHPITLEELLSILRKQQGHCAITRIKLGYVFRKLNCISIDRINTNQPYTNNNIQITSMFGNLAKNKSLNKDILIAFDKVRQMMPEPNIKIDERKLSIILYKKRQHARRANKQKKKRLLKFIKEPIKNIICKTKFTIKNKDIIKLWHNQHGLCKITKIRMNLNHDLIYGLTIDRIDSSKGYINGNAQLLCAFINHGKREFTNNDTIEIINEIRNQKANMVKARICK